MPSALLRASLIGALLLHAAVAAAQPVVVDLRNLKPRTVQSAVFAIATPQDVRIDAAGAESERQSGTFSWLTTMWSRKDQDRHDPWMGTAWILDLNSRKVVWALHQATTERGNRGTRIFNGSAHLPAGTYEAFYAAFPNVYFTDENGDAGTGRRFLNWLADAGFEEFHLTVQGNARVLNGAEAESARHLLESGTVVALRGDRAGRFAQAGFSLDRPTQLELYAEGELREDGEFDTGWIVNIDTRVPVWKLNWQDSSPGGGAAKNRVARVTTTLPAGRYAAFYATDDSHDPGAWNMPPPDDPHAWGLFVRAADGARSGVKTFTYEHVPESATLVALTRIGDAASKSRPFTLERATDVRVYAIGEASGRTLVDYGWITDAAGRVVWEMRYGDTEAAGGDAKNRMVDRIVRLEKGQYVLHYSSDDSHSFGDWNAPAPRDASHWGITLLGPTR